MKTTGLMFFCLLAGCFMNGCEPSSCGCVNHSDSPVLFAYRYTNWAWGYQERGWMIDREGKVRAYNLPVNYRSPDSLGYLSEEDLYHNLALTDTVIEILDPAEVDAYAALIPDAAGGELSEKENIAADAGSSVLTCYLYDNDKKAYRSVFLAMSGDWQQFNQSEPAQEIVDWLLELPVFWLSE